MEEARKKQGRCAKGCPPGWVSQGLGQQRSHREAEDGVGGDRRDHAGEAQTAQIVDTNGINQVLGRGETKPDREAAADGICRAAGKHKENCRNNQEFRAFLGKCRVNKGS